MLSRGLENTALVIGRTAVLENLQPNMINLSGADQQHSRIQSLIVLTDNARKILADRTSTMKMKEDALIAMIALRAPPMVVNAI